MQQTPRQLPDLPLNRPAVDRPPADPERETEIAALVDRFYTVARSDDMLGPVFESRVSDWERHLESMRDFWSAAVYRSGRYRGRPLEVHRRIEELDRPHFARWLRLWEQSVAESVRPERRAEFIGLAHRMAANMSDRLFEPLDAALPEHPR